MNKIQAEQILGVRPDITLADLKAAFRKFKAKHHPDKHVSSPASVVAEHEQKFKQGGVAYSFLVDIHGSSSSGYEEHFHSHSSNQNPFKERLPLFVEMTYRVSLRSVTNGYVDTVKTMLPDPCGRCEGEGMLNSNFCRACGGTGIAQKAFTQEICVDKGSTYNTVITIPAFGESKIRVYLRLVHLPDVYYLNEKGRVVVRSFIPLSLWLSGGSVPVATPGGLVNVKIPPVSALSSLYRIPVFENFDIYLSVDLIPGVKYGDYDLKVLAAASSLMKTIEPEPFYSELSGSVQDLFNT